MRLSLFVPLLLSIDLSLSLSRTHIRSLFPLKESFGFSIHKKVPCCKKSDIFIKNKFPTVPQKSDSLRGPKDCSIVPELRSVSSINIDMKPPWLSCALSPWDGVFCVLHLVAWFPERQTQIHGMYMVSRNTCGDCAPCLYRSASPRSCYTMYYCSLDGKLLRSLHGPSVV